MDIHTVAYCAVRNIYIYIYIYICSQRVDGLVISIISQAKERGSCPWNHGWLSGWYLSISHDNIKWRRT